MKKWFFILSILTILFVLVGCGTKDNSLNLSDIKDSNFDNSGDITFSTQYQVYGNDIERITCLIQNNTDKEYTYGEPYSIVKQIDGKWYQIPFPENAAWNALGYILLPDSTRTLYINLSYLDYHFTDGTYRITKQIGDNHYYAQFELGKSNITASTPYGFEDLKKLKEDYSREQAIFDGAIVITFDGIKNSDRIKQFVENVSRNITSMLRIVQYTIEGDPIITDITYHVDWENYYTLRKDNSRDHFAGEEDKGISETIYSYMVTDGSKIYLSNYAKWNEENDKDNVYLVDTLENDIWESIVPIVEEMVEYRIMSNSAIYKVFSPDSTKNIILTEEPHEYGYSAEGFGEMRYVENKLGIAVKIDEVLWADDNTIMIVCQTNSDMKYYEFFDIQSISVISYTASAHDYYIEDGEIIIPE